MSDARLYLATPLLSDAAAFLPQLAAALARGGVASLLLRLDASGVEQTERVARAIAPLAQERDVAVILENRPGLVKRMGLDGTQIQGAGEELSSAIKQLSPEYIVGAGRLLTRHDAMLAGEAGADYLLFGEDSEDFAALQEQARWWSELFTTPCVAGARNDAEIAALTSVGADFIMLGSYVWNDPRGAAAAVAQAQRIVAEASNA